LPKLTRETDELMPQLRAWTHAIEKSGQRCFEAEVHRVRGELLLQRRPADAIAACAAFTSAIEIARSQRARTFERRATRRLLTCFNRALQMLRAVYVHTPSLPTSSVESPLKNEQETNDLRI
jgi:predicted ATPase